MSANKTEFDWNATESAPQHYAMKIISGSFRYHGGGGGLYVPSGGVISHGWGIPRSNHITGADLKSLPDKLDIVFFSYLEDQFYQGSFDLPYDKILKLFQESEAKPKKQDREGKDMTTSYSMMVGVAPGGTVAVWMRGEGNREVFFGKAKKVEGDYAKDVFPVDSREERTAYSKKVADRESSPEVLAAIHKNGIPFQKWANYRTQYNWMPVFAVSHPPQKFGMSFYNGEGIRFYFPYEKAFTANTHAVPKEITFHYAINGEGIQYLYIITFDEPEITAAFAKLAAQQKPLLLEFLPTAPIELTQIRLRNDKEAIVLKKFFIKPIK